MFIEPFKVELWMNEWETQCTYNLAETCVASITVEELLSLSGGSGKDLSDLLPMKLGYGDIVGSPRLRSAIANLYADQHIDDITITHGTIAANMLVHKALVSKGDRVVSIVPTYQQHYSIPASIEASVATLNLRKEDHFLPDLDRLRELVTPDTKLIALTNPNNPTGALIERPMLEDIASIADSVGAYLLCDEVYRGTAQQGDGMVPSIVDLYQKGISTAGMSKVFSLAGLRVGWVVAPKELTENILIHRDNADQLLARSQRITRENLAVLDTWIQNEPRVSWVKPRAGTTAMLKLDIPVSSREFCIDLVQKTGVMLTPGDAFDMEGYARIGFANELETIKVGLQALSAYLQTTF
jgi:aspartate/methionine/tyrosine aminotransferase